MLSSIEIERLEAELEKDLEGINAENESHLLSDLIDDVRSTLASTPDDDTKGLEGFALFAESKSAVDSSLQNSIAVVQDINRVLVENDNLHSRDAVTEPDACVELSETQDRTITIKAQTPSSPDIDDQVSLDPSESSEDGSSTSSTTENVEQLDSITNDKEEDIAIPDSSILECCLIERAADDANKNARLVEERHKLRQQTIAKRQEQRLRKHRSARVIQAWIRRFLAQREYLSSVIVFVSRNAVRTRHSRESVASMYQFFARDKPIFETFQGNTFWS